MPNSVRESRRSKVAVKSSATQDAGPRPLSDRQQSHLSEQRQHLAHLHAAQASRPMALLQRTVVGVHRADSKTTPVPLSKVATTGRSRPGEATAARLKAKRRANRKKVDWPKVLLRGATFALVAELVAVALFSPRLWVGSISVEGNATVPTDRLVQRLAIAPDSNLLGLLTRRGKLLQAIKAEPTVEKASIRPSFPDGIRVSITERTPFAAVNFDGDPGNWYTVDRNLVPFRVFSGQPEASLPLVTVATGNMAVKPLLGKVAMNAGLTDMGACLDWAKQQGDAFPVEKVTIDNAGKLCLNRAGGMAVLLGPGMDLTKKLNTLSLLLTKRTDLRGSAPSQIAAVNLYAYDAPALLPKSGPASKVGVPASGPASP
jgi:POTRA domain, FtsQ-type